MPIVMISSGVLAVPVWQATPEQAHTYVETLLDWSKLLRESWINIYMSEQTTDVLIKSNQYPFRDALNKLFSKYGIVEYDVNTVAQIANRLLESTPSFEDKFQLWDILYSDVSTHPDILSIHLEANLNTDLERYVALMAFLENYCDTSYDYSLAVKLWAGSQSVQVSVLVHDIEHNCNDVTRLPILPHLLNGEISVCQNFRELIINTNEVNLFLEAEDEGNLHLAIQLALYKSRIQRGLEPVWKATESFSFGDVFFETLKSLCKGKPKPFGEKILRTIIEVIDQINLSKSHALRIDKGGGSPPQVRNEDKAMRRKIDRSYRLHYWKCSDGTIEFGSTNPHDTFTIPY